MKQPSFPSPAAASSLLGLLALAGLAGLSAPTAALAGSADGQPLLLWYDKPAIQWTEAIPVGNGRLGAMVFGGLENERLQLNEDTLWAGGPYNPVNPGALAALPEVRRLVFEDKRREADRLITDKLLAVPRRQMPYQTVGDLRLDFTHGAAQNYRRQLDLDTATTTTSYTLDGVNYTREVFASHPDKVIVMRIQASQPGKISFGAGMQSPMPDSTVTTEDGDTLVLRGRGGDSDGIPGAIRFQSRVKIIPVGGELSAAADRLELKNANAVTLLITAATNYKRFDDVGGDPEAFAKTTLAKAAKKSAERLLAAHLKDYQPLFRRVTLDLGETDSARLPTDARIQRFADGKDPQLAALYYQFGRYLLLSNSRPGSQPANLQGIWNQDMNPPWGGKYTININTEMNYWPAEPGNLPETVEPLIAMVEELAITGARTAKEMYGARGWVAHHNTDLWRATAPIDFAESGMWPSGGAWLCLHLWDRYEYSGDRAVLRRVYPLLKGSAEFFLDTLQQNPSGRWLVTNPSSSPEHGGIVAGPTMDNQILRDLFANTIRASAILGVDEDFRQKLASTRARLAPNRIGRLGQLQEWMEDVDTKRGDTRHRHVSHLYGLFPGRDISLRETPELAAAVKTSLDIRGDKSTGWATGWRICLWAHLGDAERAYSIVKLLISPGLTYPNMFDSHPPFQIDGNFGGAAGIAEMLMQSRLGTIAEATDPDVMHASIELLPALPSAWPAGQVSGLRARGGFIVDVKWRDGRLLGARIEAVRGGSRTATVLHGERTAKIKLRPGRSVWLDAELRPIRQAP